MFDCFTSAHSVYFEGALDTEFREKYNGVIVSARSEGGTGLFAIRKPITFWFKLPKFIKKLFPYKWIMYKSDREKMYELKFCDADNSIEMVADIKNSSYKKLTFDKETYADLKACIPVFLNKVGFKFDTIDQGSHITIIFK